MSGNTVNDYEIIKKLGSGAYGTVYKAKRKDGKIIALKIIDIGANKKLIEVSEKEVKFLNSNE